MLRIFVDKSLTEVSGLAVEAVPESGNPLYHEERSVHSCTTPKSPPLLASRPSVHNELIALCMVE